LDLNIIKILQKNEFYFCKNWNSVFLNIGNKFFTLYNKDLHDDYFFNRTILNKYINLNSENNAEIEKMIQTLRNVASNKRINLFLHISSCQSFLGKYLIKENFEKIDEVIGLQYPIYSDLCINLNFDAFRNRFSAAQKILLVDNKYTLKKWVNTYCLSFNICMDKKPSIYKILKNKFNKFKFVLSEISDIDDPIGKTAGCCILYPCENSLALYCLGTQKEYRHKKIATNIIEFSIKFCKKYGYQVFGLQTLRSDNLLTFYKKKGFVEVYNNKIFLINNR
jgi:N-acetylglutamate synthase-like GNAT family acetyltransferase